MSDLSSESSLSNLIGCSTADSTSDDLIKNKIQEANLLIERVKKALNKIKAIKTCESQVKSGDIEETVQNLKKEELAEPCKPDIKESVSRKVCGPGSIKRACNAKIRVNSLERPKTRRNEADDDISEDVAKNKFRNVPEERHLHETGSLVELQTKLQTISETTESDHSIPKESSPSCNENAVFKIDKEVQATTCVKTVGICADYSRETKQAQTSPIVHNSNDITTQTEDLPIQLVKRCEIECLPILEVLPVPDACVCQKCKTVLTKENLTGLSICTKPDKLQKLAVQVLPPLVIPESMTLTPVLHLSISPNGYTENHVKNSKNVAFISHCHNSKPKAHVASIEFSDERLINEISPGKDFEVDEEQKKLLWCKSYQIYDNPNKHDPGELDKQSLEKISHLDVNFYRTFINPDPVLSEPRLGFVSKSTQCNSDDQDLESLTPHLRPKKINFSLVGDNDVENTSIMGGRSITSNIESTITVLRLNPNLVDDDEGILNPFASKFVLRGSYEETSRDDSSPSAITVTMSYSLSSDEKSVNNESKSSDGQISDEVQLKVTNFDKDERLLTAKDKTTIKQIRDKLLSLDVTGGEKPYHQFLDSCLDSKKADLHSKDPTVNYVLSGSSARHLELGPNGRYKDEEHLFSQTAHPKSTFEHRDVEIAGDKLFKLPPRLRRLDTSNSDTITTNSQLSEGELLCKHSLSNGELHQCHHRPFKPRNILTNSSRGVGKRPSKKIDFKDPSVAVELRRNYFNNWVTYYVKPQDVYESTISGSNSSTVNN